MTPRRHSDAQRPSVRSLGRARRPLGRALSVAALALAACQTPAPQGSSTGARSGGPTLVASIKAETLVIASHHNDPKRTGSYVQPELLRSAISSVHLDRSFDGAFTGKVNAQPLFVPDGSRGKGTIYVATESNDVLAFDEQTGSVVWRRNFGPPADGENPACVFPSFAPIGITGTPAVDLDSRTLYVDAVQSTGNTGYRVTSTHLIHAISLEDGSERAGWPVDPRGLSSNGHVFDPTVQHQRGALLLAGGMLYVPYGSLGDCGDYHGWIVGISVSDPSRKSAYATPGAGAGIWGPSGVAADQGSIFVATGNGGGPSGAWAGGEAVLRFPVGVALPEVPADLYAPGNWRELDDGEMASRTSSIKTTWGASATAGWRGWPRCASPRATSSRRPPPS
jgi:hypothetical protein